MTAALSMEAEATARERILAGMRKDPPGLTYFDLWHVEQLVGGIEELRAEGGWIDQSKLLTVLAGLVGEGLLDRGRLGGQFWVLRDIPQRGGSMEALALDMASRRCQCDRGAGVRCSRETDGKSRKCWVCWADAKDGRPCQH